jgi:hypothetical protein
MQIAGQGVVLRPGAWSGGFAGAHIEGPDYLSMLR